jgi:hypothetical protein
MVRKKYIPLNDDAALKAAAEATAAAIRAFAAKVPPSKYFDNKGGVWSRFKEHIFGIFHNKCAYCESPVGAGDYGAVEHFRPKARVDGEGKHLGYYWLAFRPENYLPTCDRCNTTKGNKFPLERRSRRAFTPRSNLARERPLLLDPYEDDPGEHLEFHEEGLVEAITEKGQVSIECYGLAREGLVAARRDAQFLQFTLILSKLLSEGPEKTTQAIQEILDGKTPYSAAVCVKLQKRFFETFIEPVHRKFRARHQPAPKSPSRWVRRRS